MTLAHVEPISNACIDVVVDALDVGSANPAGQMAFREGTNDRATSDLQNPAFSLAAARVANMLGVPIDSAPAIATVTGLDNFEMRDRDRNVVWSGTITGTGGGGDIEMADPTLAANDIIRVTSYAYNGIS